MYEKLEKLRAEVAHCKQRIEEDKQKLKQAERKLLEAENAQIISDVSAMNLTPEELAVFLRQVIEKKGIQGAYATAKITEKTEDEKEDENE